MPKNWFSYVVYGRLFRIRNALLTYRSMIVEIMSHDPAIEVKIWHWRLKQLQHWCHRTHQLWWRQKPKTQLNLFNVLLLHRSVTIFRSTTNLSARFEKLSKVLKKDLPNFSPATGHFFTYQKVPKNRQKKCKNKHVDCSGIFLKEFLHEFSKNSAEVGFCTFLLLLHDCDVWWYAFWNFKSPHFVTNFS